MPDQYFTTVGSGTQNHIRPSPLYDFPDVTFPGHHSKKDVRTRRGDGVVVLNPEDFSVSLGVKSSQITVTSVVELTPSPLENRRAIAIHNNGSNTVYIGHTSSVTTANGFPLIANEKISIDLTGSPNTKLFAISDGTSDVRILEVS